MVADIHRTLLKGGIFIYPSNHHYPNGKLRLMYECNPLAFIIEQAGGIATDGNKRILDILPGAIHQKTPIYIGSTRNVEQAVNFLKRGEQNETKSDEKSVQSARNAG